MKLLTFCRIQKDLLMKNMWRLKMRLKRTIKLPPGYYDYRASAPGVIPYFGSETLKEGIEDSWKFYITNR